MALKPHSDVRRGVFVDETASGTHVGDLLFWGRVQGLSFGFPA